MSAVSLALVLTGVFLNAVAQLLLKAGTNAVGHFEFLWDNALPFGMKLAANPAILGGMTCFVISLVTWIITRSCNPDWP
jgi:hypothetical protein